MTLARPAEAASAALDRLWAADPKLMAQVEAEERARPRRLRSRAAVWSAARALVAAGTAHRFWADKARTTTCRRAAHVRALAASAARRVARAPGRTPLRRRI